MHALITNDDGVASDGIRVLAQVAAEAGLDVLVAAPARDLSGASASLTATLDDDAASWSANAARTIPGWPASWP